MTELEGSPKAEQDEADWHNGNGEAPDHSALTALHLAHQVLNKFPELTRRYQKFIGPVAVVSTAVLVLTSIAISRRLHKGESPDRILAEITPDEIESAGKQKPAKPVRVRNAKDRVSH